MLPRRKAYALVMGVLYLFSAACLYVWFSDLASASIDTKHGISIYTYIIGIASILYLAAAIVIAVSDKGVFLSFVAYVVSLSLWIKLVAVQGHRIFSGRYFDKQLVLAGLALTSFALVASIPVVFRGRRAGGAAFRK